ncbi:MAG: DUF5050 domain-containing protein [Bacteroidales bacterium]|nr:DUF5050 domain-containing protein [Lachnoclostridium sp.]MCM1384078.1 DUF5050 domain-containing protein [Lachnoclostridium sp.]MCM1465637.1 DUF5050 domain-containing protein [Bacteroidales bacterium]
MHNGNKKWLFGGIAAAVVCLCSVIYIYVKISGLEEQDISDYQRPQENAYIQEHFTEQESSGVQASDGTQKDLDMQESISNQENSETQESPAAQENPEVLTDQQLSEPEQSDGKVSEYDDERIDTITPISTEMMDQKKVGDYIYFRYMIESIYSRHTCTYPALFRCKEGDTIAERMTEDACFHFEAVGDCVYYVDSCVLAYPDHGILYLINPDGSAQILDDELYDFQIVDEQYIYYTYCHDTVGVGIDGHALQRMNLDGSDKMIAAWEVTFCESPGTAAGKSPSHFNIKVEDGWADYGDFKMELGAPADGTEKLVCNEIGDNDYIYYVTNRLMKARRDGSERVELDGTCDYYYQIEKIEDDWIYYRKGGMPYKIRTDGTGKTSQ